MPPSFAVPTVLAAAVLSLVAAPASAAAPGIPTLSGPVRAFTQYDGLTNSLEIQAVARVRVRCPEGEPTQPFLASRFSVETTIGTTAVLTPEAVYERRPADEGGYDLVGFPSCTGLPQLVEVYYDAVGDTVGDEETRTQGEVVSRRTTVEFGAGGARKATILVDQSLSDTP